MSSSAAETSFWETIAAEAARESSLWGATLRPSAERDETPVFSPLAHARFALGLESIYEGYLLHYGRPRLFEPADADTRILLGDYLYAHGLVRIAALGDADVVADLAELLSLCAQLRAAESPGDGAVWAATVALLGEAEPLEDARRALRERGDPGALLDLAERAVSSDDVARALTLHGERVD